MTYQDALCKLKALDQEHLLQFYDTLSADEQQALLQQIEETDFSYLQQFALRRQAAKRGEVSPLPAMTLSAIDKHREEYRKAGIEAIRAGKLACVLLAGGMGTRLGSNGPKGIYDIGITHPVYIFQRLFEELQDTVKAAGALMHFFIMTSDANDEMTRSFLAEHNYFGYPEEYVHFFRQAMAPCADENGKLLLDAPSHLAVSPNGNGGWLLSLSESGMLRIAEEAGVEWLNVFAVDNVLQKIGDPVFFGAALESGCASASKVVRKSEPAEKVGVMCLEDGKPSVIEYFEMSQDMLEARNEDGEYAYYFGVILNYLFRLKDSVAVMHEKMPLHFAHKAVPHIGTDGTTVRPSEPNAWKFEYFIFDLLHELDGCLPFEVIREKEFAPVKNRTGVDSVDSARALLSAQGYEL
ncbi:MAG: UTP--glucose-1-phosphate uridylyltransferase [Lachnospiraceae bacterium]|nr:UTP--glucose-1-phosphate uridylyltransferase [Lachnospiraceae bacterium]